MFEMMAGRSPFDIVGSSDNPDQNTEDYLFQGNLQYFTEPLWITHPKAWMKTALVITFE